MRKPLAIGILLLFSIIVGLMLFKSEMRRHSTAPEFRRFQAIACSIMAVQALVAGVVANSLWRKTTSKIRRSQRIWGDLVEFRKDGDVYLPVVRYTPPGGEPATFQSKLGKSKWDLQPSDKIAVLFDPAHPTEPEIAHFLAQWLWPLLFAYGTVASVLGLIVFGTGVWR